MKHTCTCIDEYDDTCEAPCGPEGVCSWCAENCNNSPKAQELQSYMLLTDSEWHDLAAMLAWYKGERLTNSTKLSPTAQDVINRRTELCDRIIGAAHV